MTLATQTSRAVFSGNGVTTLFPLPFPFLRDADLQVLLRREGVETLLVQGTHYVPSGAGAAAGGSLLLNQPPATGESLVVWRAPAIVQEVDYVENSAFPAETHEAALDLLTMICQSLQQQLDRCVRYPMSTPDEEVLDTGSLLETMRATQAAAGAAATQAASAAAQAAANAATARDIASTANGLVKVSATDTMAQSLSSKLTAGNGLAESLQNSGAAEFLRLSVALAPLPGLEFASGLLRVKPGSGLYLSEAGLAVNTGSGSTQIPTNEALRPVIVAGRVMIHTLHGGM